MKANLHEFIEVKIDGIKKSIKSREESAKCWRSGDAESWRVVGCKLTKQERFKQAEIEERILVKLWQELKMFESVLLALPAPETNAK